VQSMHSDRLAARVSSIERGCFVQKALAGPSRLCRRKVGFDFEGLERRFPSERIDGPP